MNLTLMNAKTHPVSTQRHVSTRKGRSDVNVQMGTQEKGVRRTLMNVTVTLVKMEQLVLMVLMDMSASVSMDSRVSMT